jgi:hypothetical protein
VLVTAANVHDSRTGRDLMDHLATGYPTVTKAWADGASGQWLAASASRHGRLRIVVTPLLWMPQQLIDIRGCQLGREVPWRDVVG